MSACPQCEACCSDCASKCPHTDWLTKYGREQRDSAYRRGYAAGLKAAAQECVRQIVMVEDRKTIRTAGVLAAAIMALPIPEKEEP